MVCLDFTCQPPPPCRDDWDCSYGRIAPTPKRSLDHHEGALLGVQNGDLNTLIRRLHF